MDRYSKVQSSLWSSEKFEKIGITDRYVYLYLLSNSHANSIGLYKLKIGYACTDLNIEKQAYRKAIESLSKAFLICFDEPSETMFIPNYLKFNPITNENHAKGSQSIAEPFEENPLYPMFYADLNKFCKKYIHVFGKPIERLSKDYRNTDTDTDTNTETETERDTETNTDKDNNMSDVRLGEENQKQEIQVPYKKIQSLYNSICSSLPKCIELSDKRKEKIRVLFKKLNGDMNAIRIIFEKTEASEFLSGRNLTWCNCSFDWLINYNNAIKVLEGNYDNKTKTGNAFLDYAKELEEQGE